ncbi:hypothetical protein PG994_004426 [Apiospora phragmitis]|uniref:Uncharacterized protein n=1 Tax=Apiospora phragmitis TaxID=2905665 RepID=A0ABR1VQT4_9PEZI
MLISPYFLTSSANSASSEWKKKDARLSFERKSLEAYVWRILLAQGGGWGWAALLDNAADQGLHLDQSRGEKAFWQKLRDAQAGSSRFGISHEVG